MKKLLPVLLSITTILSVVMVPAVAEDSAADKPLVSQTELFFEKVFGGLGSVFGRLLKTVTFTDESRIEKAPAREAAGSEHNTDLFSGTAEQTLADGRIGRIYDCLEKNGLLEDGLFIVTADHGHKETGGHGRFSKIESYSTIAVSGKTVVRGGKMDDDVKLRDIAAISLYALGVQPTGWSFSARVPGNLFTDVKGQARPYHGDIIDLICGTIMWIYTNLGHPFDEYF